MEPPLFGEHPIHIVSIQHIAIHASPYLDVQYRLDGDPGDRLHVCRIGRESVVGEPQPGTGAMAEFAMRTVVRITS